MNITELVAQLRNAQSVSKRKMLDAAADTIERLSHQLEMAQIAAGWSMPSLPEGSAAQ